MVTFNKFALRKDETGNLFLDLELNMVFAPQKTIMLLSFPASAEYQRELGQPIIESEQQELDNVRADRPQL